MRHGIFVLFFRDVDTSLRRVTPSGCNVPSPRRDPASRHRHGASPRRDPASRRRDAASLHRDAASRRRGGPHGPLQPGFTASRWSRGFGATELCAGTTRLHGVAMVPRDRCDGALRGHDAASRRRDGPEGPVRRGFTAWRWSPGTGATRLHGIATRLHGVAMLTSWRGDGPQGPVRRGFTASRWSRGTGATRLHGIAMVPRDRCDPGSRRRNAASCRCEGLRDRCDAASLRRDVVSSRRNRARRRGNRPPASWLPALRRRSRASPDGWPPPSRLRYGGRRGRDEGVDRSPPETKQKQLAAMAEAIRAEAPAAGMIVLFGSHARGDWVDDAETGYRSD